MATEIRLKARVHSIYPRAGQVSGEMVMALRDICDAETGDQLHQGMSVPLNKHGKSAGIVEGDWIEFDAKVSTYNGKAIITGTKGFRRLSNY